MDLSDLWFGPLIIEPDINKIPPKSRKHFLLGRTNRVCVIELNIKCLYALESMCFGYTRLEILGVDGNRDVFAINPVIDNTVVRKRDIGKVCKMDILHYLSIQPFKDMIFVEHDGMLVCDLTSDSNKHVRTIWSEPI